MHVLAIRGNKIFDGERVLSGRDLAIVIDDRKIVNIIAVSNLSKDVAIHNYGRVTLLPGLVDAHVHLVFPGSADPIRALTDDDQEVLGRMRAAAQISLSAGITAVRDLGDLRYLAMEVRTETALDPSAGPMILAAGPPITTPGGHCWFLGAEASGPAQLTAQVAAHVSHRVDVIKVMASGGRMTRGSEPWASQFSTEELTVIQAEAHSAGLPTTAHAHGAASIRSAVRARFDCIEHATFTTQAGLAPDPELIDELATAGVFVSLALGVRADGPPLTETEQRRVDEMFALANLMRAAGVKLICSSDAGVSAHKPHGLLPHSIAALAKIGFTTAEALHAATAAAASACRMGDRKGRLARGYDADILAVSGDPFRDIDDLHRVVAVYREGQRSIPACQGPTPIWDTEPASQPR
jgi:imidazolonepropionase-like amidohydrolase